MRDDKTQSLAELIKEKDKEIKKLQSELEWYRVSRDYYKKRAHDEYKAIVEARDILNSQD